jgi:RNA polymerase sigma factor (sigma-70 family)
VKITKAQYGMALKIARAIMRRMPCNVLREDLEQAALLGLVDALTRHPEGGQGPGFEWYLAARVRGSVLDELRRQDWSSRRRGGQARATVVHMEDVSDGGSPAQFATDDESPEDVAIRQIDAAKAWGAPLSPRDARIMEAAYQRGRKWRDIGVDEGVSEARISQRVSRSLIGMRSHLTGQAPPLVVPGETRHALSRRGGPA